MYDVTVAVQCLCALGEGPIWSDQEQRLLFVDINGRAVYRFDPLTKRIEQFTVPGRPGFVLPRREGGYVLGMEDALYCADSSFGVLTRAVSVPADCTNHRINDGFADSHGRLYFGILNELEGDPTGRFFRCNGGQTTLADSDGYVIPNGPAASPCGKLIYHSDTLNRRVDVFDCAADGSLSGKQLFASMGDERGYPDGIAVDTGGRVWVSLFGGGGVLCFSAEGELVRRVDLPVTNVTKVAFGGPGLKTAFVTTARKALSERQLAAEPLAGAVFRFDVDVAGQRQNEVFLG